jgi:hypothetical protein
MANPNPTPRFVKGDPRINRKGRPKSFDALRELAKEIANEKIVSTDGKTAMTRVELILREMSLSKDPRQRVAFLEIAYGKVPNAVELTGKDGGAIPVELFTNAVKKVYGGD